MAMILHLEKILTAPLALPLRADVALRSFRPGDLAGWLQLRNDAMGDLVPVVRPWTADDFARHMLAAAWWSNDCTQLACVDDRVVGSLTLAKRGSLVVLHWLVVDRSWRRKGVGRVLVEQAEQIAWQRGVRRLGVETHGHWHPAVEFWQRLGYLRPGT